MKDGMRRDETPAHESLREAFVNALIHADYSAPGGVVIERMPDRFMMENPGTLLVSQEQLRKGGVSECRNKALQQMFLMIGGGERAGSGVDKIRSGWKSHHWRSPTVGEQQQPDRVIWILPMLSLIPAEILEKLRQRFGVPTITSLPGLELQAVATVELEGHVTNRRMQELVDEHSTEITKRLQALCAAGFLESDNRRRWTTYRFREREPSMFDGETEGDSQHLDPNSQHLDPNSQHLDPNSQHLERENLPAIAAVVAQTGKAPPSVVQQTILALCRGRFLTVSELAKLLNRHPTGLQQRFLKPMRENGMLQLRYPQSGNRPDQAYTSAQKPSVP
jgi:ATP-dependent DNA helicase RecG